MSLEKNIKIAQDEKEIDQLVEDFFDLFTNTKHRTASVQNIKNLFLSEGILINNTTNQPAIYDLASFIKPRAEILSNGTLTNFEEHETSHNTTIQGNIAQRASTYEKSGELEGNSFYGTGTKFMHFVKKEDRWLFSSVIWTDHQSPE